jgi:hypothetical protein
MAMDAAALNEELRDLQAAGCDVLNDRPHALSREGSNTAPGSRPLPPAFTFRPSSAWLSAAPDGARVQYPELLELMKTLYRFRGSSPQRLRSCVTGIAKAG